MIIEPRLGSGKTKGGLHVEVGLYVKDTTRRTRMIGDVLATFACKDVSPGDVVVYRYGSELVATDAEGEELFFLSERHVLFVR
jgi:hypothetical protein